MFKPLAYSVSLDEVAVVPESITTYSDSEIDLSVNVGGYHLGIPVIGASMDSVSSVEVLRDLSSFGGFGFLNLCGLISRYKFSEYLTILGEVMSEPTIETLQKIYNSRKIDVDIMNENLEHYISLIGCDNFGVSATPQHAKELLVHAIHKGVKLLSIQASFISPYWNSDKHSGLNVRDFVDHAHSYGATIMVGNVASLNAAVPFIEAKVDALLVGIGPGYVCSTRNVLGIGSGHITAVSEIREYVEKQKSSTKVIADGGIRNSGEIIKLMCCGAHAVMLGSVFAGTTQAPFNGVHWGMAAPHGVLPRGTIRKMQIEDGKSIEKVLFGPTSKTDGSEAIIPAIRNAFSNIGCKDIQSAYLDSTVVRFPGFFTEGKNK